MIVVRMLTMFALFLSIGIGTFLFLKGSGSMELIFIYGQIFGMVTCLFITLFVDIVKRS